MQMTKYALAIAAILWLAVTAAAQPPITLLQNFDGIPADNVAPPNTTGKAGASQFVQWVNNQYAIYDKNTGAQIQPPQPGNVLWANWKQAGPCATANNGDPMVEYDKTAGQDGQWVFAQLALSNPAYYCFAISTTSDARGPFHYYKFHFATGLKPNTPRLAVWTDAYYASFNFPRSGKAPAPLVVAYDRAHMLLGQKAMAPVSFRPSARINFLPSDFDGAVPPAPGEPDFFVELGASNYLSLWQFHVDFASPVNSSFNQTATLSFSAAGVGCSMNPPQWNSGLIRQPAAAGGTKLVAYPEQLMYRLAWRNVNQIEHLVANQTVVLSSTPPLTGVVWFDIVNPDSDPALAQYGAVSNAAISYWIGSLAQDKDGDIALGFNASSPNLYPSVEIAGRLESDPLGTMSAPEFLVEGGGAQANTSSWGAHADMSLDPSDDCVFWFTAEYVKTTQAGFDWSTRIGSFRFNACQ
jgi:hypothetical protein